MILFSFSGIKARLVQMIRYQSPTQDKTRECEVILKAIGGNRIPMNHTKVWDNQLLWIPSIPPTNKNLNNNFIEVTYHVQVSMFMLIVTFTASLIFVFKNLYYTGKIFYVWFLKVFENFLSQIRIAKIIFSFPIF